MLREKETDTEFDKMIKEVKLSWEKQQPKLVSYIRSMQRMNATVKVKQNLYCWHYFS